MARILSDLELEELTGYQMPGKQLEALRNMGLIPVIRADGRPRVTDEAVTRAMCGDLGAREDGRRTARGPDWSALRKTG